jgi:hypothetical protein
MCLVNTLFFILLVLVIIEIARPIFLRIITVDRYEYLELLNLTSWKAGRELRHEMQRRKGGRIDTVVFFADISKLADEQLIEVDIQERYYGGFKLKIAFYCLTNDGGIRRDDLLRASSSSPNLTPRSV